MPDKPRELGRLSREYFRVLQQFGRNDVGRRLKGRAREALWRQALGFARLPYIPLKEVHASWLVFVEGSSSHSGLVVNGDIDPSYVSVGVTYHGVIGEAHTTKITALLKKLLAIYARRFRDPETFYRAVLDLCPKPTRGGPDD